MLEFLITPNNPDLGDALISDRSGSGPCSKPPDEMAESISMVSAQYGWEFLTTPPVAGILKELESDLGSRIDPDPQPRRRTRRRTSRICAEYGREFLTTP